MRAIVQRVDGATVSVDGKEVGRCGIGLLLLVGVHRDDTRLNASKLAEKIANLRIFNDLEGKMNLSLLQLRETEPDAGALAVSNFTVYGDTATNRRPSFMESAPFELGRELFASFLDALVDLGIPTQTGVFGADMRVALINNGPVTVIVDA